MSSTATITLDRPPAPPAPQRYSVEATEALFNLPFLDLLYRAQQVHRAHHKPNAVQLSTLLSIKTGGCPEDCAYCTQAARYQTGVVSETMLDVAQVTATARAAKDAGTTLSPLVSDAHSVPAQQLGAPAPQTSPATVQVGPTVGPVSWVQTRAPAGPRQTPETRSQQSSSATQGAPSGAQALAQVSVPFVSGRQRPSQHCELTEQGSPSGRQVAPADGPRQRSVPFASAPRCGCLIPSP